MVLYLYLQNFLIFFFMHMSKVASIINWILDTFLVYFTMFLPTQVKHLQSKMTNPTKAN